MRGCGDTDTDNDLQRLPRWRRRIDENAGEEEEEDFTVFLSFKLLMRVKETGKRGDNNLEIIYRTPEITALAYHSAGSDKSRGIHLQRRFRINWLIIHG